MSTVLMSFLRTKAAKLPSDPSKLVHLSMASHDDQERLAISYKLVSLLYAAVPVLDIKRKRDTHIDKANPAFDTTFKPAASAGLSSLFSAALFSLGTIELPPSLPFPITGSNPRTQLHRMLIRFCYFVYFRHTLLEAMIAEDTAKVYQSCLRLISFPGWAPKAPVAALYTASSLPSFSATEFSRLFPSSVVTTSIRPSFDSFFSRLPQNTQDRLNDLLLQSPSTKNETPAFFGSNLIETSISASLCCPLDEIDTRGGTTYEHHLLRYFLYEFDRAPTHEHIYKLYRHAASACQKLHFPRPSTALSFTHTDIYTEPAITQAPTAPESPAKYMALFKLDG